VVGGHQDMALQSYKELEVWQLAMDLAEECYQATKVLPKEELFGMTCQIRRAAASIPANIAEGQGREHTREFLHHLSVARGSLMELETHLFSAIQASRLVAGRPVSGSFGHDGPCKSDARRTSQGSGTSTLIPPPTTLHPPPFTMLTSRGWLFAIFVVFLLVIAVGTHQPALAVLMLSLGFWFAWEWLVFAVRARVVVRQGQLYREVCDERGPVDSLWAGRTFTVRVVVRLEERLGLSYVSVVDRVPFEATLVDGEVRAEGALRSGERLRTEYRVRCPIVGRLRFEGVKLRLADFQGFFYHATFVRGVAEYRVLPRLADASGRPATKKRHNLLPPPGIHRLRRPGSGSELLDLRDYMPGDPPKTIAWKVSARRDRLITKEFESEVPIRSTLFVDASNSVRVGQAGGNALSRLVDIAAAVAQANSADRDLTGLCLFDERRSSLLRPARGPHHLVEVLNRLADAGGQPPATGEAPLGPLVQLAHAFAEEVYPDLLRCDVNRVPFWLPWLARRMTPRRQRRFGARALLYALTLVAPSGLLLLAQYAFMEPVTEAMLLASTSISLAFAALIFLWPRETRLVSCRKRVAALLAARYRLAPGGLALLLDNDEQMGAYLHRFLAEHRVPYGLPLYDEHGRYRFVSPQKVAVLAGALLRAVGKGHDNELFVLLADLLEVGDHLKTLLGAVRVALARHHQVLVVCPWPPGVPPASQQTSQPIVVQRRGAADVRAILERAAVARFHRAYQKLRRTFARLGVQVVSARGDESVPLILDRIDHLRMLGRRR